MPIGRSQFPQGRFSEGGTPREVGRRYYRRTCEGWGCVPWWNHRLRGGNKMKHRILLILLVCLATSVSGATAHVIRVPSEYPTIQAGIDAAVDGDTVLVADGIYRGESNRKIDFYGKAIVVMSENGPEMTIIDVQGEPGWMGHGFGFHSGEDSNSVVQGFTITNGWGGYAGGITCSMSSPTIRGNILVGNVGSYGGGIYCRVGSSPLIENNIIIENEVIYPDFYASFVSGHGGGIYCSGSCSSTIRGNVIARNKAVYGGGGIACSREGCSPFIEGNLIVDNLAIQFGGGFHCNWGASPIIRGNTIAGNSTYYGDGGGICCWHGGFATILNCIFWADSARYGREIYVHDSSEVYVSYSDVEGGWEGEGNIDVYPEFVRPGKGDLRLLWGSPCIDAGHPDSLDPDGTRSDMGAYPFDQSTPLTIYLTPDTTVYHRKENLGVTYTVINIDPDPVTFSLRTDVYLPNGKPYPGNPIVGPKEITLGGGKTRQRWIKHYIPGKAPFGVFTYTTTLEGVLFDDIIDEDSFRFVIEE
jgi:hypothetical protein